MPPTNRSRKVVQIAERLEGLSRHAGMHAAGVVIAPRPIIDYLPLYRTNKDEITTQFDMNAVEKMGLLKIDFLGLITLDILDTTKEAVRQRAGVAIDLDHLPLDDEPTYELFRSGKTACVFQFDSGGMRDLLRRARPRVFADLAALNALFRPGALDAGTVEEYVRRRNGTSRVTYPLPEIADILEETLGILVYQEQVMRIASARRGLFARRSRSAPQGDRQEEARNHGRGGGEVHPAVPSSTARRRRRRRSSGL